MIIDMYEKTNNTARIAYNTMFYHIFFVGIPNGISVESLYQYGTIWDILRIKCTVWVLELIRSVLQVMGSTFINTNKNHILKDTSKVMIMIMTNCYETTKSIQVETGWRTERVKLGERGRSMEILTTSVPNFDRKKSYEQKITMMPRKIRKLLEKMFYANASRVSLASTYRLGMSVFKHKKVRPGEKIGGPLCSGVRRVHDGRICRGNQELRGKRTDGRNRVKLYKILKRKYSLVGYIIKRLTQFDDNPPSRKSIVRLLFTILAMTNSSRSSNKAPVQQSSRVGEIEIYRGAEGGVVGKLWVRGVAYSCVPCRYLECASYTSTMILSSCSQVVLLHIMSRFLDDQEKNDRKSVEIEIFEERTKQDVQ
ncbi:hypothetical protein G5I_01922 [Acromyrmex echinatior]|uniref:Uncharacterized protein n=1 Tax=Acromyrmex echinatior TaxID=103372 RepID=F4W8Y0_ACREC|nr:hypothetical protein G5I_01922 [Acromyrmex echinatior]